jgi:hypothetical protein
MVTVPTIGPDCSTEWSTVDCARAFSFQKATAITTMMLAGSMQEIRRVKTMVTEKGVAKKVLQLQSRPLRFPKIANEFRTNTSACFGTWEK